MTDDKYLQALDEAQRLINTLLNDPEHGKLTFAGVRGLDDLTITGPEKLNNLLSGAVLTINDNEWLALSHQVDEQRRWQCYLTEHRMTSEELYLLALKSADNLYYIHDGYSLCADL